MVSSEEFENLRQSTAEAANAEYSSTEVESVCKAWDAVGVPGTNEGHCAGTSTSISAPNTLNVTSWECYGEGRATWNSVSGATRYELYQSTSSTDFNAAIKIYDGSSQFKMLNVPGNRWFKVKACNNNECSILSDSTGFARYFSACY
jgi:hypothetical protein